MARTGKIARLPHAVRSQLNLRLLDGEEGKPIVQWLNSLPEVQAVLAGQFGGRPINEQNLSEWRQGGHQEWLARQDMLAQAAELAAHRQDLESVAPGQSFADHLAAAISFRFGAILAAPGPVLDDKSLTQLKALGRICQAVVKLRRGDHNAARLKIEMQRWELDREQLALEKAEAAQRKLRETLAAPVWGALKKGQRLAQFGGGIAARLAVEYLNEIELCQDPAHFQSKVLAAQDWPAWKRYDDLMAQNPPVPQTPVQAAADMLHEIDVALGFCKPKPSPASARPRRPAPRPARNSAKPEPQVQPAPAPAAPAEPAPPPPASGLPVAAPAPATKEPIGSNQT